LARAQISGLGMIKQNGPMG